MQPRAVASFRGYAKRVQHHIVMPACTATCVFTAPLSAPAAQRPELCRCRRWSGNAATTARVSRPPTPMNRLAPLLGHLRPAPASHAEDRRLTPADGPTLRVGMIGAG
eukprot:COSAG06_NODE_5370_length_3520_cov_5.050570_1_plen_107_part_10